MILKDNRKFQDDAIVIGYLGENKAEKLTIEIPEYLQQYSKKIIFCPANGTNYIKLFDDVTSNTYTFTNQETQYSQLDMCIQFYDDDENIIYKSSILHIIFDEALICDDDVTPDSPKVVLLDKLISKVSESINEVNNIDVDLSDNVITITKKDGTTKRQNVKGDKGDTGDVGAKGDKGDTGEKGDKGNNGNDATINGVNAINILAGDNITLKQEDNNLTINCTQTAPKIINTEELQALHNQTGSMASGQIWCGSFYTLYGDGLYYLNVECGISNTKESTTDKCYKGTTVQVMNDGHLILCYASSMVNAIKVFKTSSYVVDLNSNYSLINVTSDKLYELFSNLVDDTLLTINNTTSYTPTSDYQPTPKKYVDDKVTAERSIYYAEIFASNWYDASVLQPILDLAYKGGYDDVFIKIKDGTRYIQCAGLSLQTLSTSSSSTFMWANLKYITGSSTTPNTIFYGYACANGVKLDENGDVSIDTTGLKQGSIKVMKDADQIIGYDKTKTQVLKNVNGTLTWVNE